MIHKEHIFPLIIIILCFAAGAVFLVVGDIRKGIFWTCVGAANLCATF